MPEEELAHLDQVSAVATEVTSSIQKLRLEVEEKKKAVALLQKALVGDQDLILYRKGVGITQPNLLSSVERKDA